MCITIARLVIERGILPSTPANAAAANTLNSRTCVADAAVHHRATPLAVVVDGADFLDPREVGRAQAGGALRVAVGFAEKLRGKPSAGCGGLILFGTGPRLANLIPSVLQMHNRCGHALAL
jgi:hypothetical protein